MMDRKEILKGLIGRLSRGESMEEVRAEFKRHFQDVPAEEIAAAASRRDRGRAAEGLRVLITAASRAL